MQAQRPGALLLAALLLAGACGGDDDGLATGPSTEPPPPERTVKASPSFQEDIVEIIQRRGCMATGCHGTGAGTLTLADTATSYANLVNVGSACNGLIRVVPSKPDSSYLVMKVEGTQPCGSRMPLGDLPLDSIDIQNIRNWVQEDAFNN